MENVKYMEVHFQDIKSHLLRYIEKSSYCIGCVAWCTDFDVLDALASRKGAHIIIQNDAVATRQYKHDTFRPKLREKYRHLKPFDWLGWERAYWNAVPEFKQIPFMPSALIKHDAVSVRVCGQRQTNKQHHQRQQQTEEKEVPSMMHHKFLLYLNAQGVIYGVSTGSYNFSKNASQSLENFQYIEDPRVAQHYFLEYLRVLHCSEPLRI